MPTFKAFKATKAFLRQKQSLIMDFIETLMANSEELKDDPNFIVASTLFAEAGGDMEVASQNPDFLAAFLPALQRLTEMRQQMEGEMDDLEELVDSALKTREELEAEAMDAAFDAFVDANGGDDDDDQPEDSDDELELAAGGGGGGGGGGGAAEVKPKSKTPCSFFAKGSCTKGESCRFSHSLPAGGGGGAAAVTITKSKTICSFFVKGICTKGDSCRFSHQLPAGGGGAAGGGQ